MYLTPCLETICIAFYNAVHLQLTFLSDCFKYLMHKCTAWWWRGYGRIPNAGKLAIIRSKFFNIWANYTPTFTFEWGSGYFAINS